MQASLSYDTAREVIRGELRSWLCVVADCGRGTAENSEPSTSGPARPGLSDQTSADRPAVVTLRAIGGGVRGAPAADMDTLAGVVQCPVSRAAVCHIDCILLSAPVKIGPF